MGVLTRFGWGLFHYVFGFGFEAVFHIAVVAVLLLIVLASAVKVKRMELRPGDKK